VNDRAGDTPSGAHSTLRLRAELRAKDNNTVMLESETGTVFAVAYEQLTFEDWAEYLRNQAYRSERFGKQSQFRDRTHAIAQQLVTEASVDHLCERIADAPGNPATVLLQIEIVDRELDNIPWEVLAHPIAQRLSHRRVCVYRTVGREVTETAPPSPPVRVLPVDSAPLSLPTVNFSQEAEAISCGLQAMENAGLIYVDPRYKNVNYRQMHDAVSQPARTIHIAAHGKPGELYLKEGRSHLRIESKPFAEMLLQKAPPAVIVLSICDSSRGTLETPAVARAVADAGVGSVLGMWSAITELAALAFFTRLYQALGSCCSIVTAYARAVAALRATAYPDSGFWSVPVLYSQDNVIPFPRTMSDPGHRYERLAHNLSELKSEVLAVQPRDGWIAEKWRHQTMDLRLDERRLCRGLEELIEIVHPEYRNGSKWAEGVRRTAQDCLWNFKQVVKEADKAVAGNGSASEFCDSQDKLLGALRKLEQAISVRLQFSA
jgi:CHAT domain